jgi:hypothetical protein
MTSRMAELDRIDRGDVGCDRRVAPSASCLAGAMRGMTVGLLLAIVANGCSEGQHVIHRGRRRLRFL